MFLEVVILDVSMELSKTIASKVNILTSLTVEQLKAWGHSIAVKKPQAAVA